MPSDLFCQQLYLMFTSCRVVQVVVSTALSAVQSFQCWAWQYMEPSKAMELSLAAGAALGLLLLLMLLLLLLRKVRKARSGPASKGQGVASQHLLQAKTATPGKKGVTPGLIAASPGNHGAAQSQDAGLEHQLVAIEPVEDRAALEAKVNAFTAVGDFANAKRCALRLPQSFSMAVADLERTSLKVSFCIQTAGSQHHVSALPVKVAEHFKTYPKAPRQFVLISADAELRLGRIQKPSPSRGRWGMFCRPLYLRALRPGTGLFLDRQHEPGQ